MKINPLAGGSRGVVMREITQIEEYDLRGRKVSEKVQSVIKSGRAKEILIEDVWGKILFRITPDGNFINQTLDMVGGIVKVIKGCKVVVIERQEMLFN